MLSPLVVVAFNAAKGVPRSEMSTADSQATCPNGQWASADSILQGNTATGKSRGGTAAGVAEA